MGRRRWRRTELLDPPRGSRPHRPHDIVIDPIEQGRLASRRRFWRIDGVDDVGRLLGLAIVALAMVAMIVGAAAFVVGLVGKLLG